MLDGLDQLIEASMKAWQIPGLAIAVIHRDEAILLRGHGQRDPEEHLPVTEETQFQLCSITKSFTAAGLGLLVDEGRLKWTSKVKDLLPEFRLKDPVTAEQLALQDLLSHHSGFPRHDWVWSPGGRSTEQILAAMRHLEPSRELREVFQYQNLGYLIAGAITERVTGQSWIQLRYCRATRSLP